MSDTQQGPDWWLASDGKWYPPTSTPDWGAVDPPSPALSLWLQVSLWGTAVFGVLSSLAATEARTAAQKWRDTATGTDLSAWSDANDASMGTVTILALLILAAIVLAMVWMNTAHKHQNQLQPEGRKWGSGWTVGAWFLPVANFVVVKLVLNQIERIAATSPDLATGSVGEDWKKTPVSLVGNAYWLAWTVGTVLMGLASVTWDGVLDLEQLADLDLSAVLETYRLRIIGGIAMAISGVFGALHFRRLSRLVRGDGLSA